MVLASMHVEQQALADNKIRNERLESLRNLLKITKCKKWDIKQDLGNPKPLTILSKLVGRDDQQQIKSEYSQLISNNPPL